MSDLDLNILVKAQQYIKDCFDAVQAAVTGTQASAESASKAMDAGGRQAATSMGAARQSTSEWDAALRAFAQGGIAQIPAAFEKVRAGQGLTIEEQKKLNDAVDEASTKFRDMGKDAPAALTNLRNAALTTEEQYKSLGQTLGNVGTGLHTIGTGLTVGVTAPLVAAGAAGLHFAGEFQTNMTRVQSLAGASATEVSSLRQQVLDLGPSVGVGPAQLAQGLFVLESAGFRGKTAMESLTVAGKMTAVGMGETEAMARGLVGVMLSYQNQNLSAAQAGDILTKTVQLGNMKIDELVPSLARVNPLAAAMGIKFQDVAAAIATFTHMGAPAEVAATGLRAILSNILNDSAKTEKGFALLSKTLGDTTITMSNFRQEIAEKGLAQALINLMEKANAAGEKGTESLNKIFPNIKALTEVLANAKANGVMYLDITEKMMAADGTLADSMAATRTTFAQHWKEFTASADKVFITLGDNLLPVMTSVMVFLRDDFIPVVQTLVRDFSGLPDWVKTGAIAFAALAAALGPAVLVAGSFARGLGGMMDLITKFPGGAAAMTNALGMLGPALVVVAEVLGAFAAGYVIGKVIDHFLHLSDVVEGIAKRISIAWGGLANDESYQTLMAKQDALKLASERSGRAISDMSEALKINGDWVKAHNAAALAAAEALKVHTDAAGKTGAAVQTLSDKVKALTEDQRADIESKREQGYQLKAIATETGIAQEVVSAYLKQQQLAHKGTSEWAKALAEYNSVGADYRSTVDAMSGAVVEGIKWDLARGQQQGVLQKIYGVTAEQIKAIIAVEKQDAELLKDTIHQMDLAAAAARNLASIKPDSNGLFGLGMQTMDLKVDPKVKVPDWTSWMPQGDLLVAQAQQHIARITTTWNTGMTGLFQNQLPQVITGAIQGGGNVVGSVVSALGGQLGGNLGKMATGALTSTLGSTLGPALAGVMGPLGAMAGQLIGPLWTGIKSLFGGVSEEEKKARDSVHGFELQLQATLTATEKAEAGNESWKMTTIAVRDAYIATGRSEAEAEAAVKQLWDSSKGGAEATKAAIDQVTAVLNEQKQDQTDLAAAVQRYGFSIEQLGPSMRKQKLDEQAQQLLNDWRLLVGSGIDIVTVDEKMTASVEDYLKKAQQTGVEVPAAMKPILQSMIDQGQLTDDAGNKITDLGQLGVTFSETMTQGFEKIVNRLDLLLQKIGMTPGKMYDAAAATAYAAQSMVSNLGDVEDAVNAVNFGHSPGGLKEIPLLLAQANAALAATSGYAATAFSGMEGDIYSVVDALNAARLKALEAGDAIGAAQLASMTAKIQAAAVVNTAPPVQTGPSGSGGIYEGSQSAEDIARNVALLSKKQDLDKYNQVIAASFVGQYDPGVWFNAAHHYFTVGPDGRLTDVGTDPSVLGIGAHAAGGLFKSEHVARIAEAGKPEIVGDQGFMTNAVADAMRTLGIDSGGSNSGRAWQLLADQLDALHDTVREQNSQIRQILATQPYALRDGLLLRGSQG